MKARKRLSLVTAASLILGMLVSATFLPIAAATGSASEPAAKQDYQLLQLGTINLPYGSYDIKQATANPDGVPNTNVGEAALAQNLRIGDARQLHGTIVDVQKTVTVKKLGKIFVDMTSLPDGRGTPKQKNSGSHKVELFKVKNIPENPTLAQKDAAVKDQANWESVASTMVTMDWDTTINGFNWEKLETEVTIQPGTYVLATEQGDQLRAGGVNFALKPADQQTAFTFAAPIGFALAPSYGTGECDAITSASNIIFGGANLIFSEPEEAAAPPQLSGTILYQLTRTDASIGTYDVGEYLGKNMTYTRGESDNFGSVFFATQPIRIHELGRIYIDQSEVPSKALDYQIREANIGSHEVTLFRIKDASISNEVSKNKELLLDSSKWEKVASATVNMNDKSVKDGFNWAKLSTPVDVDSGMYVVVTAEDKTKDDIIMVAPGQVALKWPVPQGATHTGFTIGKNFAGKDYTSTAASAGGEGNMFGIANLTFTCIATDPGPTNPSDNGQNNLPYTQGASKILGKQGYRLAYTNKPVGSYDVNLAQAAGDGVPNVKIDNGIANVRAETLVGPRNEFDSFGTVFFVNTQIYINQLGRLYVNPSSLPAARNNGVALPANSGTHRVTLFKIKGASSSQGLNERNALLKNSENWEEVTSVVVKMGSDALNGFNWSTLKKPVRVDTGMYVVVTEEDTDLIGAFIQKVYDQTPQDEITHTGLTMGTDFGAKKYADSYASAGGDGNVFGGANFTYSTQLLSPSTGYTATFVVPAILVAMSAMFLIVLSIRKKQDN